MTVQRRILLFSVLLLCCGDLLKAFPLAHATRVDRATAEVDPQTEEEPTASDSQEEATTTSDQDPKVQTAYSHLWPNKTVYYTFGTTLSAVYREAFTLALTKWSDATCIKFELAAQGQDHIRFVRSDELGCSSLIGRRGGTQFVSMNHNCFSMGEAMHQIGHAIGLWHEHLRPDRDEYIEVLYDNIILTEQHNFQKLSLEQFRQVPDVGYDIESIMHSGPYAFSNAINGTAKRTIRLRPNAPLDYKHCSNLLAMGQRDELSYLDKLRANKLYSCQEHIQVLKSLGRDCTLNPSVSTPIAMTTAAPGLPFTSSPNEEKCPLASLTPISPVPAESFTRIKPGSVITLQLDNGAKGVRCSPKCRPKSCQLLESEQTCHSPKYQFEITLVSSIDKKKILSGSKVALRSRCTPNKWLSCDGSDKECSISKCKKCTGGICSADNYTTPCSRHYFRMYGVGRQDDRLLHTNHKLYFRHDETDLLLTCLDDLCKLSSGADPTELGPQAFSFTMFQ